MNRREVKKILNKKIKNKGVLRALVSAIMRDQEYEYSFVTNLGALELKNLQDIFCDTFSWSSERKVVGLDWNDIYTRAASRGCFRRQILPEEVTWESLCE